MARSSQTQRKRQRENKLREKAQLKRERRQQRQAEKKKAQEAGDQPLGDQAFSAEIEPGDETEPNLSAATADTVLAQAVEPQHVPAGGTRDPAEPEGTPQIGGIMASKLFVGNLPRSVTDSDLADFVSSAGFQVTSAQVIRDRMTGEPKGFGFVELAEGTDLQQAIGGLNGKMLQDRRLTVNEARPQRPSFSDSRGGPSRGGRGRGGFGRRRDY
jgi:cold-inducible RNA-binding protein